MDVSSISFPPVTGFLLAITAAVTLPCLTNPRLIWSFALSWPVILRGSRLWAPFTCFFYAGSGLQLVFNVFSLYHTSTDLEQAHSQDVAAYSWTLFVLFFIIHALNALPIFGFSSLFSTTLTALLYIWSRENPTAKVSLFGLVRIPSRLYPGVLVVLGLVNGGVPGALLCLMGVVAGHIWWFVTVFLPLQAPAHLRHQNPFIVPLWWRRLFQRRRAPTPPTRSVAPGVTVTGRDNHPFANANEAVRHRWGSGNRLGTE